MLFIEFVTNLLNPAITASNLSRLPQFGDPAQGQVLLQSIILGFAQIAVSFTGNLASSSLLFPLQRGSKLVLDG